MINRVEHVRLRPGMYFGGVDKKALHLLLFQLIDDSVEEARLGYCKQIDVELRPAHEVLVRDESRGLPIRTPDGSSFLQVIMSDGGAQRIHGDFVITGSLFAVGLMAINALSAELSVEVARDGYLWWQTYRQGIPTSEVIQVRPLQTEESTGTTVVFRPDFSILEPSDFDYEVIVQRAREIAATLPDLTITIRDLRTHQ